MKGSICSYGDKRRYKTFRHCKALNPMVRFGLALWPLCKQDSFCVNTLFTNWRHLVDNCVGMSIFLAAFTPAAASFLASAASAATVNIDVRGSDGKPLAGAVVMLDTSPKSSTPIKFDYAYEMAQQNIAFVPHVLIIPVGASVTFPNRDKVSHHVYSFSKAKKFDLKLYGKDETRAVVFNKAAVVALGSNIHDAMSGFVIAVDTPFAVQTDANGRATMTGVPIGGVSVRVRHPLIHAVDNILTQAATLSAAGFATTYTIRGK